MSDCEFKSCGSQKFKLTMTVIIVEVSLSMLRPTTMRRVKNKIAPIKGIKQTFVQIQCTLKCDLIGADQAIVIHTTSVIYYEVPVVLTMSITYYQVPVTLPNFCNLLSGTCHPYHICNLLSGVSKPHNFCNILSGGSNPYSCCKPLSGACNPYQFL